MERAIGIKSIYKYEDKFAIIEYSIGCYRKRETRVFLRSRYNLIHFRFIWRIGRTRSDDFRFFIFAPHAKFRTGKKIRKKS